MTLPDAQFDKMVSEAWASIPEKIQNEIEDVAICIEEMPAPEQLSRLKVNGILLGLFEGVPKNKWGQATLGIQPSKISLFKQSILSVCNNESELRKRVKIVLMHEIGHYFGHNDEEMYILDAQLDKQLSNK